HNLLKPQIWSKIRSKVIWSKVVIGGLSLGWYSPVRTIEQLLEVRSRSTDDENLLVEVAILRKLKHKLKIQYVRSSALPFHGGFGL
ncbi:hypothetical protein L9F63_002216, partial [Diploptera punctata]